MKDEFSVAKHAVKILFAFVLLSTLIAGCSKKKGCMYKGATNYDPSAEEEDGSCIIPGCMNPDALNYDQYANTDNGTCEIAGLGGTTIIVAKPRHHGATIYNQSNYPDTAYVKFSAHDFPGQDPSSYDAAFAGAEGEDHVNITGLKPGYYYIWMAGFDTSIVQRVTGGIPYTLTQASGQLELVIPVTE
jgi:hypothetical protein